MGVTVKAQHLLGPGQGAANGYYGWSQGAGHAAVKGS